MAKTKIDDMNKDIEEMGAAEQKATKGGRTAPSLNQTLARPVATVRPLAAAKPGPDSSGVLSAPTLPRAPLVKE